MPLDLRDQPANPGSPGTPPSLPSAARRGLAVFLSLFVLLFLADAVISLGDDSLILFKHVHTLTDLRILVGLVASLAAIVVYGLMALTPAIPKRLFVPLALFPSMVPLLLIPLIICYYGQAPLISWLASWLQVVVGLWILFRLRGRGKFSWPLVPVIWLADRGFSWRNLVVFMVANIFGLLPAVLAYLFLCTGVVVNHFTDGFMTLHPTRFTVQARTYTRDDGETIQLFPMAHVAEADFYQNILQTFPTNATILMEGVTDEQNLLTNKISYKRMARSLGLAEQHEKFIPRQGKIVRADIDIDQFSTNTITLLNLVILSHTQGVNAANAQELSQYSPSPDLVKELFDDLLMKRNRHLLAEIQDQLPQTKYIVVPWGVAHMPWIAREIQKLGFHLQDTREYTVIRFFHADAKTTKATN
jgi:hypothetical protein